MNSPSMCAASGLCFQLSQQQLICGSWAVMCCRSCETFLAIVQAAASREIVYFWQRPSFLPPRPSRDRLQIDPEEKLFSSDDDDFPQSLSEREAGGKGKDCW